MHGGQISLPISDGPLRAAAESPVALTYKRGLAPASQRNDPLQFGYLARPWLYNDGNNRPSDRVTNAWRALRCRSPGGCRATFHFPGVHIRCKGLDIGPLLCRDARNKKP